MKGDERMRSDAYSQRNTNPILVMPGPVPGIHVFKTAQQEGRGWPGLRLAEAASAAQAGQAWP
jgi:hypothetical protein